MERELQFGSKVSGVVVELFLVLIIENYLLLIQNKCTIHSASLIKYVSHAF